jgi:uncharacterized protein YutE (UPF0331/DUF86 family)
MVDKAILTFKLQELERYLAQLRNHQGITAEIMESDLDKAWIVQRGLQLCIQIVLDIGNHLLAETNEPVNEYADIFPGLARLKIIPEDYALSVKGMAGLRNLLVHEYSELNMEILADAVNNRLDDFNYFAASIMKFLDKEQ